MLKLLNVSYQIHVYQFSYSLFVEANLVVFYWYIHLTGYVLGVVSDRYSMAHLASPDLPVLDEERCLAFYWHARMQSNSGKWRPYQKSQITLDIIIFTIFCCSFFFFK